jgi:hypothetical protein
LPLPVVVGQEVEEVAEVQQVRIPATELGAEVGAAMVQVGG